MDYGVGTQRTAFSGIPSICKKSPRYTPLVFLPRSYYLPVPGDGVSSQARLRVVEIDLLAENINLRQVTVA